MIAAALVATTATDAQAAISPSAGLTYVEARAAAMRGDHDRAAQLLAGLAERTAGDATISRKALGEAIGAGDMPLALRLVRQIKPADWTTDARLLLIADALRRGQSERAMPFISGANDEANLQFLEPLLKAWAAVERRDLNTALGTIDQIPANSLLGPFRVENRAFILLKFRRAAEAEPFARQAIAGAGGRENRLRLALADGFLAAGDQARAQAMIDGMGTDGGPARLRILAGKRIGLAIDEPARAYAELLLGLAVDLNRINNRALPISMVQIARYADPRNGAGAVLLALLLENQDQVADALVVLNAVPLSDPLAPQARDAAARILVDQKRFDEALTLARSTTTTRDATAGDFARLGDVLQSSKRYNEAADAYGRAIGLTRAQGRANDLWPLLLLQSTALEAAGRWPETKQALQAALVLSPEQPLILNFLGYAKLERGEDLDAAEAMIRKASALAPDDASITDSLGWALFKRGRFADAIATLERAAAKDPQQSEIHEHLGDALFSIGRRYEARFAWNAALISADDDVAARIRLKIAAGLTPATAAP
ncbi:tetratricopeptide repeat protein [Sphingomonas sp.]|uniref:tetratricopeptide repeat protein n=1 Tax=Sphingomonas sp. TaxID=28214 RepID=UPI00286A6812|nr:tetratricopeptide repeat protein [Sphingomonas sp.]